MSKRTNATSFLDPDQLTARLADVAHEREELSGAETAADTDCPDTNTTVSQSETPLELDDEIVCYYQLRGSGGRPACSIETFRTIRQTPESYQHILGPWESITGIKEDSPSKQVKLFSLQFYRWKTFLSWQCRCRGRTTLWDNESSFDSFTSASDMLSKPTLGIYVDPSTNAFLEYTEKTIEKYATVIKLPPQDQVGTSKAVHLQSKLTGVDEVFTLREDPTEQNVVDSWIEYLIYETINRDSELSHLASSNTVYESESHPTQTLSDSEPTSNPKNEEPELLQYHSEETRNSGTNTSTTATLFVKRQPEQSVTQKTTRMPTNETYANDISTVEDTEPAKSQRQNNAQRIIDWIVAEIPTVKEHLRASSLALSAVKKRKHSCDNEDTAFDLKSKSNMNRGRGNHIGIPAQPNYDPEYAESKKRKLSTEC